MDSLKTLSDKINADYVGKDLPFQGVSTDSRKIQKGMLFVALKDQRDGHEFAADAVKQGAAALMVDHPLPLKVPQIIVPDTLKGLGQLAQQWRAQFHIPIIALTGSCGKTSTKEMIRSILQEIGPTLSSFGTYNNAIGVPLTLLQLQPLHRFAVIEMGTNSPGEIAYISRLAQPQVALITNISTHHAEKLGSVEGVSQEKSDIFLSLPSDGIAVINVDEAYAKTWEEKIPTQHRVSYGFKETANVYAKEIVSDLDRNEFTLMTPLGPVSIGIPLLGRHIVANAIAAAAAALSVGAGLHHIAQGLAKFQSVPGRMSLHHLKNGALLIDDTYNASFKSVENALDALRQFSGRTIFVMSNMGEMGKMAAEFHRNMGRLFKEAGIDEVLLFGDQVLLQETLDACPQARYFENKMTLIKVLLSLCQKNTMIVVKGSHANHMNEVVDQILKEVGLHD